MFFIHFIYTYKSNVQTAKSPETAARHHHIGSDSFNRLIQVTLYSIPLLPCNDSKLKVK